MKWKIYVERKPNYSIIEYCNIEKFRVIGQNKHVMIYEDSLLFGIRKQVRVEKGSSKDKSKDFYKTLFALNPNNPIGG